MCAMVRYVVILIISCSSILSLVQFCFPSFLCMVMYDNWPLPVLVTFRRLVCLSDPVGYTNRDVAPDRFNQVRQAAQNRGQTKISTWSSRLGVGRGANNSTP